jgi:hypothetical protein
MIASIDSSSAPPQAPPNADTPAKPPEPATFGVFGQANPFTDRFTLSGSTPDANAYRNAVASVATSAPVAAPASPASPASPTKIVDTAEAYAQTTDGKLPHNATIVENGYQFTTDNQGRVVSADGNLSVNSNAGAARTAATKAAQRTVGWQDRLPTDYGGHLIADRFNGPGSYVNLMAQNGNFNLGEYKKLENGWAKELAKGNSVHVNVELNYPAGSLRPSTVSVQAKVGSRPPTFNVYHNAPGGKAPATGESTTARNGAQAATDLADASAASKLARGAEVVGKIATPIAVAADAYSLYSAYKQDGNRIGSHTVDQAGSVAGDLAGAAAGAEMGAEAGTAIGAAFGGVGAGPGLVIGGAVGAVVGGVVGSGAGKAAVQLAEKGIDLGKKAWHSVSSFLGI